MNKPIFKWLLIFKDGAHLNAEGEGIEDACQAVGRTKEDLAISTVGFLKALPLKRTDNAKVMDEKTKEMLKTLSKQRRSLRNSGRAKNKSQT